MNVTFDSGWYTEERDRWFSEFLPSVLGYQRYGRIVPDAEIRQALADPSARDCEWLLVITMPHEIVFWAGKFVPAWEGDVERRAWEAARAVGGFDDAPCRWCAREEPCYCGGRERCRCTCGRCLYPFPLPDDGPLR